MSTAIADAILNLSIRPNSLAAALDYQRLRNWIVEACTFDPADPQQKGRDGAAFFACIDAVKTVRSDWSPVTIADGRKGLSEAFAPVLDARLLPWSAASEIPETLLTLLLALSRNLAYSEMPLRRMAG